MTDHAPLNPMQVESEIARLSSLLEERVGEYERLIRLQAEGEHAYKATFNRAYVESIDVGTKMTVPERTARAEVAAEEQHAVWLLHQASARACQQALSALRTQIEALRTLAANQRVMSQP